MKCLESIVKYFKKKMENLDFVDHDGIVILTKKQSLF